MENRAKQFMSFDALKGFRKLLEEKEQIICLKKELSIDDNEELSNKIRDIHIKDNIEIIYYFNKEYTKLNGKVTNIDFNNKIIIIENIKVRFIDIIELNRI